MAAATEGHLGSLKAKLAKYRNQLIEDSAAKGPKGEGFEVVKHGHARVAMIGFPSVGKVRLAVSTPALPDFSFPPLSAPCVSFVLALGTWCARAGTPLYPVG